jgi:hypothetical protein
MSWTALVSRTEIAVSVGCAPPAVAEQSRGRQLPIEKGIRMEVRLGFKPRNTVSQTGAKTGRVLGGATQSNKGLRLRILQDQSRGTGGPISGRFHILSVGDNQHSDSLETLLGQATDAEEVIRTIRQEHPQCVNVVNANILIVEKEASSPAVTETIKSRDSS